MLGRFSLQRHALLVFGIVAGLVACDEDKAACSLHGDVLVPGEAPYVGLQLKLSENGAAYPNANVYTPGGCTGPYPEPEKVMFCPRCRDEWKALANEARSY